MLVFRNSDCVEDTPEAHLRVARQWIVADDGALGVNLVTVVSCSIPSAPKRCLRMNYDSCKIFHGKVTDQLIGEFAWSLCPGNDYLVN
jgi:hypothetical protein